MESEKTLVCIGHTRYTKYSPHKNCVIRACSHHPCPPLNSCKFHLEILQYSLIFRAVGHGKCENHIGQILDLQYLNSYRATASKKQYSFNNLQAIK